MSLALLGTTGGLELVESLREGFVSGVNVSVLLALACVLGVGLAIVLVVYRVVSRARAPGQKRREDYLTLAVDLLGLTEDERRDLVTLTHAARLAQPATVLMSPANMGRALLRAGARDAALHSRLGALCERLYGVPLTQAIAAALQREHAAKT